MNILNQLDELGEAVADIVAGQGELDHITAMRQLDRLETIAKKMFGSHIHEAKRRLKARRKAEEDA